MANGNNRNETRRREIRIPIPSAPRAVSGQGGVLLLGLGVAAIVGFFLVRGGGTGLRAVGDPTIN
jgi:hypothetical protein